MTADLYAHHSVDPGDAGDGFTSGARFGATTAVGDFDHDGFADVAVGAPSDSVGGKASGTVSVFMGSATGLGTGTLLSQSNLSSGSDETGDQFGMSLAAGDFDKDGFADLAIGIPGEAVGSTSKAGAIALFKGSSSGLTTGTWMDQEDDGGTSEANDAFGTALAAGDINGDGFADLAVGAPGEAKSGTKTVSGWVWVLKGSSGGLAKGWSSSEENASSTSETGDRFGESVAIGNVTGDSHADLLVGAPGEAPGSAPAGSGAVYVVPGASGGNGTGGFSLFQSGNGGTNEENDHLGAALAVGDFDHDGHADIAAGVPGEAPDTAPAGGSVVIFPGAATKTDTAYWIQQADGGEPVAVGDGFGTALAAADTNGDGFADLLVGSPGRDYGSASGAGTAFLFDGGPRRSGSTQSLTLGRRIGQTDVASSNESGDAFGSSVAMGDITGDGDADAVVGSSGEAVPGHASTGAAHEVANLAPHTSGTRDFEMFSATNAEQASLLPSASVSTIDYAYTDNIGHVVHGFQPDPTNFNSVQWTTLPTLEAFTGTPAMAERADGMLQIAAHDVTSDVWLNTETGRTSNSSAWGPFVNEHGSMASNVTLVAQGDGTTVGFAVDSTGVLWVLPELGSNGSYSSWISTSVGGLVGPVTAVRVSSGVQVFAVDTAGDLKSMLYSGSFVTGCTSLNATGLSGAPSAVVFPGSRVRLFVRAADGSVRTQMSDLGGTFPGTWDTVPGFTAVGAPSAVLSPITGTAEVVARDAAGLVWSTGETAQGSGQWRTWKQVNAAGDESSTDPTAFTYTNANGPTWAVVFRRSDQLNRVYNVSNDLFAVPNTAGAKAPTFSAHSLPAPPR